MDRMKRKYADRRGWRRIIKSRIYRKIFMWPDFHGEAVLIQFDAVKAPLSVLYEGVRTKTVDRGYSWLQLFPDETSDFVLTVMFNHHHQLVQCYFDVINRRGRGMDGILWFDDLYLDLILFPDHKCYLVDENELNEALESGIITPSMYNRAWHTARQLETFVKRDPDYYLELARQIRSTFP
ncbi:DUF402 domain-containing protein [Sporolactobacillus sp. THM19-2]|uniref:DUF402 domain-containing protein n=1 Tax=Sporolactobacillus sp. THM19-2 TaxID=2511171 RepID=UPI001F0CE0C2|nr:DUF402 domain-containing protein [Sporolactobacillus sp. THM19-2]